MKNFVRAAGARVTPRFVVIAAVMGVLTVCGALAPVAAQAASCSGLQIVYARGTGEEANPYGAVLGNTLVTKLQAKVPGTTAVAVKYPASLASSSPTEGNTALVNYVTNQAAECPSQKFVLAGYSQGANVVAMSFGLNTSGGWVGGPSVAQLPASLASHVTAVLMFAPPYNQIGGSVPSPYSTVTRQYCAKGDLFCSTEPNLIYGALIHLLAYQGNLSAAAAYAASNYANGVVAQ